MQNKGGEGEPKKNLGIENLNKKTTTRKRTLTHTHTKTQGNRA